MLDLKSRKPLVRSRHLNTCVTAILVFAFGAGPACGQTFVTSADTYTKNKDANQNFGSRADVRVQIWSDITGFARFDLSAFPAGESASSAVLVLSVDAVGRSGGVSVHKVLGDWAENTLTANTRPPLGPAVARFSVSRSDNGRDVSVEVTDIFNELLANPANDFGIALVHDTVNVGFFSRESGSPMRIVANSGGGPPPGPAQTVAVTADAYTKDKDAGLNFGSRADVRVQKWSSITGFMKFDLSQFATNADIQSATLRIVVQDVGLAGSVSVRQVLGDWGERTINAANRPALGGPVSTFTVSNSDVGNTIAVDVTDVVRTLVASPAQDFGLAMTTTSANFGAHSRESGTPVLLDIVTGDGGPPPPPPPPPPPGSAPNIVFYLADDLGWGDVGVYNSESRIPTPTLDQLARDGVWFADAHSTAAKCAPSRYSAITGNYQWRGRSRWGAWDYKGGSQIFDGQQTIGDILQAAGYETAAVGKWHLGGSFDIKGSNEPARGNTPDDQVDFSERFDDGPLQRGFDYSYTALRGIQTWPYAYFRDDRLVGNPSQMQTLLQGRYGRSVIPRDGIGMPYWDSSDVGPDLVNAAIGFINSHHANNVANGTNTPFFLYYASQSAHGPYTPPANINGVPVAGATGITNHTDMIYETDVTLGLIIEALENNGLNENTLIIFASDNGGLPIEVNQGHDSVAGLRGRKGQIFEGGHRVPLIFKWGDGSNDSPIPSGRRSDQLASLSDIAATIAGLIGAPVAENQGLDSYDLSPILLGSQPEQTPIRSTLVMQADRDEDRNSVPLHFAVRDGDWKLVFDEANEPVGLYNLALDLDESNNRIGDPAQAQRVQSMDALLDAIVDSTRSAP